MSSYIINVKNTSGDEGTVIADIGFSYTDNLNAINEGQLKISGTGETKRDLFEVGSEVKIYRNGTLEFHGIIDGISYLDGGGISANLMGYEIWLAKENGTYPSSPWSSTASATIANAIIGESNYFSAGTVEAGLNIDFRASEGDSLYNALKRLVKRVGQDIGIDYANLEVDILDHKGNSTSVQTFNDGIQIGDVVARKSYPIANYVKVFGKSEGQTRIKSDSGHGQDATSQSTYGVITKIYNDPSVDTVDEANALADQLVAKYKDPVKVYEFDVWNPNQNLVSGDVITLNSTTKGLNAEEVRIVSLERGVRGDKEFLILEVTNKEYSEKSKGIDSKVAEIEYQNNMRQTYDSFQAEYANANVPTCIGGDSYFCSGCWNIGGKLWYNGIVTCLCDIFSVCYGNQYLSFDSNMTVCAPQFQAGFHEGVSSCWSIFSAGIDMCGACIINAGTICANCFCGPGAGGEGLWTEGTYSYIVPCNSCSICVPGIQSGDIIPIGADCLGCAASPGVWEKLYVNCITGPSGIEIYSNGTKLADFGATCTCLPTIRTKNIHAYANGSCSVGIDSCRFGCGYINCMFTCRKLKIPVGTNCY